MTDQDPTELTLEIARQLHPVGQRVTGKVTLIPRPGTVGLFVDLGTNNPPWGFVDVLHLPDNPDQWLALGTTAEFEVVSHTHEGHQVRLVALDPEYRSHPRPPIDEQQLYELKRRLSGDHA